MRRLKSLLEFLFDIFKYQIKCKRNEVTEELRRLRHSSVFVVNLARSPGGGGTPNMKGVVMLVVSLRGVNFGF